MSGGITGGCLCGGVRYTAAAAPGWVNHCHCRDCQQQTGAAMATWVTFVTADVTFTAPPTIYPSSATAERGFCATCGSTLTWQAVGGRNRIDLAAGTLDDPSLLEPREHLFWARHLAWLEVTDPLPRHDEWRPKA